MSVSESQIRSIVEEVLGKIGTNGSQSTPRLSPPSINVRLGSRSGVFNDVDQAAQSASNAFLELKGKGYEGRAKAIEVIKAICTEKADEWGKVEFEETKIGRLDHKIAKLVGIKNIPGVEWMSPTGMSGDHGIAMEENAPWGVVGVITPVTHSIPTVACNAINMIAAGNSLLINPHPGGAKCAAIAVDYFNKAIEREIGIASLLNIIESPTLETFDAICAHELVNILCVTGGPGVVDAAMKSGKRSICAGPGNPPVVVDDSADLDRAARDIIIGAGFDNNLLCIGEKQVFVVDSVYSQFINAFKKAGAGLINNQQLAALTKEAFTFSGDGGGCSHPVINRSLVGANPSDLARVAGANVASNVDIIFAETRADDLFVIEEQMMPMIPVVRVKDIFEGIAQAKESEHGYKHSAMIHTMNVRHMSIMARELDTTIFVKNGPCLAGLGIGGEGYPSFSIATTTGEGISTPKTFTRTRRCVLVDDLNLF